MPDIVNWLNVRDSFVRKYVIVLSTSHSKMVVTESTHILQENELYEKLYTHIPVLHQAAKSYFCPNTFQVFDYVNQSMSTHSTFWEKLVKIWC